MSRRLEEVEALWGYFSIWGVKHLKVGSENLYHIFRQLYLISICY